MDHAAMLEGGAVCERYDSSPTPFLAREMGCYFSHLGAMIHAVGRGYSRVMICEDDVEFLYVPEFLRRSLEAAPPDADMLYLFSTCAPGCGLGQDKDRRYCNEYWRTASHEGDGAVAYIANARSISYLLRNAFPMRFTLDGLTKWPSSSWCDLDLRCYMSDPLLCGVRQVHSIIHDQPRFIGRLGQ
jgi:GR25 family glycosyltransferase involved in LPS biosynthesis